MATYYHDFGSMLQDYVNQMQRFMPTLKPPTQLDPSNLIKGVQPVLQQEERRAQQAAAAQFAKLGLPVSSAYQERLGRIGGETAAKLADITNRYMFEAAKENAQMQWQAQLEQYRQMMQMLQGLMPQALSQWQAQAQGPATGYESSPDALEQCRRNARSIEDLAACEKRYKQALGPLIDPQMPMAAATQRYNACMAAATTDQERRSCYVSYSAELGRITGTGR